MSDTGFVHRFVPAKAPDYPPLLLLHGTGGDENDLIPLGERLAPGAALLSPRGKVLEGAMPRFFRRLGEGDWDLADFRAQTAALADFLRQARAAYQFGKPVAVGFSNGANIGWSLLLHDPSLLAGAILIRPMVPFDPRPLPDLTGLSVLILSGAEDTLIPRDQPGLLAALLGEAGADATYEVLPAGHGLTAQDIVLAESWLHSRNFLRG
ncbi:MAG: alpha/beta hydrolase [Pseudorhodoplanes sp.]|jgi:phospholipase/carboxylesterase|nr:alpha/beta hydrolase [Pseudorhodoplanes sp.]